MEGVWDLVCLVYSVLDFFNSITIRLELGGNTVLFIITDVSVLISFDTNIFKSPPKG